MGVLKLSKKNEKKKLTKDKLDVAADVGFVNSVLGSQTVQVDPDALGLLLDTVYTLARDKIVEAHRFAKLKSKTRIDEEDLRVANLQKIDELQDGSSHLEQTIIMPNHEPKRKYHLLLPPWCECECGINATLKVPVPESDGTPLKETHKPASKKSKVLTKPLPIDKPQGDKKPINATTSNI